MCFRGKRSIIVELEALVFVLEKLVGDKNKDEGGQKVEEGVGESGVRCEFRSSDMEFGWHGMFDEHDHINMQFEGERDIDQSNMYKRMKQGRRICYKSRALGARYARYGSKQLWYMY